MTKDVSREAAKARRAWILFFILAFVAGGVSEFLERLTNYRIDIMVGWVGAIYAYEVGILVPSRLRVFAASRETEGGAA